MQRIYRVGELKESDRDATERLLGRQFLEDEFVEIAVRNQATSQKNTRKALDRILEPAKGKTLGRVTVRDLIEDGRR